ncbi:MULTISPECIES: ribulose bisphosphate carboxylase small subunit [Okeania]|uniref:AAA family ATPase n=1 Tax=Okeania hirsuta TaxID=1458930 RepID=A0A3N6PKS8_9CYAN|nr:MULTISPECIES: ribulose bisphosphate carboxylase small subunit [Okeania]NET12948.1 AAA family ATPase [Okeania sp. SIO1H6]NES78943.1 AAA family ATPase [Okeania sp. SIO1H4]NES89444.1 AAA family ATPase [Okeania sp. SIO2B9]NET22539.1 AAA family ATPase [Okeania sp. SIO1H5]NET79478.1 AAA family ATPase [Okeania sp. SIO1F9]
MPYYISSRFIDKLAVHITKNFLDLPRVRMPLILGIHGRKGEGKTFQCQLVLEKMGIEPVTISGGELESKDAGDPARLLRLRYREASEKIKVQGRMCALFINDLDAGAGRFDGGTQYTVNTQLVNATLMNIADNPTNVQLPGSYDETPLHRIPIIVTGNDFSTLYAPLIRDGRMEKFYWEPNREDRIGIVGGIFKTDELSARDIENLVDEFSDQAIDFFSALRSRIYDEQIRDFIHQVGIENISKRVVNSVEKIPDFPQPNFNLSHLLEYGKIMVGEQQRIRELRLVEEYNQSRLFGGAQVERSEKVAPNSNYLSPEVTISNQLIENRVNHNVKNNNLSSEVREKVQQILQDGLKIGMEYADKRRYKTGSWKSCGTIDSQGEKEVINAVENCLAEHQNDYVRLIGIDSNVKRRLVEKIIHKPN